MRPEAAREAQEWLVRAERDLLVGQLALRASLRHFLTAHDQPFPKSHNLLRLRSLCEAVDVGFTCQAEAARLLSPYATQFRYPSGPLEPSLADAEYALFLASGVLAFVRERLGF